MSAAATIVDAPRQLNQRFDRWFTASEVNAAGRMGLFRILYGLFLLWIGSQDYFSLMAQTPATAWRPILLWKTVYRRGMPTPTAYQLSEFVLILAVVLLIIGYHVRLMTVVVFLVGMTLETLRFSYGRIEHGSVFQSFYIPLIMIMSQWGATHSLDAELKARRIGVRVSPSDSSWRYIWPMRVLLFMLAVLFLTAAYWKWNGTPWIHNSNAFATFLLKENIEVTGKGGFASPLLVILAQIPLITFTFRFAALFFEMLFFTALLNNKLRNLIVSIAILFHAINAVLAYISFSFLLIVYALFVDWQHYYERWWPSAFKRFRWDRFSTRTLIGGSLAFALVFALLWTETTFFRRIFSLGGLIDWRTIWLVLLPFGVIGFVRANWILLSDVWKHLRRTRRETASRRIA